MCIYDNPFIIYELLNLWVYESANIILCIEIIIRASSLLYINKIEMSLFLLYFTVMLEMANYSFIWIIFFYLNGTMLSPVWHDLWISFLYILLNIQQHDATVLLFRFHVHKCVCVLVFVSSYRLHNSNKKIKFIYKYRLIIVKF